MGGHDLVHLDFQPANVLVEDGRITGIIDWTAPAAATPASTSSCSISVAFIRRGGTHHSGVVRDAAQGIDRRRIPYVLGVYVPAHGSTGQSGIIQRPMWTIGSTWPS